MKTMCQTDGHFYIRTAHTVSTHCFYCTKRRMPWSRESFASLRALVALRKLSMVL